MKEIKGGITAARGFKAGGIFCGIKKNRKKDLALIYSTLPSVAAGVFTTNKVFSPSVQLCRENILLPVARAVVVNSGNANACVGNLGYLDARKITRLTAGKLKISSEEILIASTGVIGEPLPMDRIESGIPDLVNALDENGSDGAAEAILTTDTCSKTVAVEFEVNGSPVRIGGIAKGAGMIEPNMATMLAFITTDAVVEKDDLQKFLIDAVDTSFNLITVDGDMSTNDSVVALANGAAKNETITRESEYGKIFSVALQFVTSRLARLVVQDGEGATKFIEICVSGADSFENAKSIAFAIARSNLVKTAFFGEDANWGRILGAAGAAGVDFNPDKIDLIFGEEQVVKNGVYCGSGREEQIDQVIKKKEIVVTLDLNSGNKEACVLTCDLSLDYVKINADYRS